MKRRCFESDWGACTEKAAFRKFWSRIPQASAGAAQAQIVDAYELFMQAYDFYAAQVTTGSMEIGMSVPSNEACHAICGNMQSTR